MPLVQYSDSESEPDESDVQTPPAKRSCLKQATSGKTSTIPPLPAAFHDLYASTTRVSTQDDPSLHGGRKRVIPHVEGNWPTHLYLEWYPSKEELLLLDDLIPNASSSHPKIQSLLHSDLGAQLPLHISLSRPVVLRTEQRRSFEESLQKKIEESQISPFVLTPDGLKWVSNYERTRCFLVLHVAKPEQDSLNSLLHLSNSVLDRFNQPPLYASRNTPLTQDFSDCFHISLAWTLNEPSQEDKDRVSATDLKPLQHLKIQFDGVKVKIGNNHAIIKYYKTRMNLNILMKYTFCLVSCSAALRNFQSRPRRAKTSPLQSSQKPTMQIPTVTLEDLQAFQAQHFPGQETLIEPTTEPEYGDDGDNGDDEDDEDLGYYPDGVKRTLTDEQIRIFRHSEIHALLRARQLEQDNAEYEARQELSEKDGTTVVETTSTKTGTTFKNDNEDKTNKKEQNCSAPKMSKRPAEHDIDLSYEEDRQSPSVKRPQQPKHTAYPGRRIISYDD
ncbi:hypothetical protein N7520_004849 [Penicillium odoratum]|uniref:uncharacterized protein n=1 Tax=Penicillium odoratum TaxID=1167516 RepID=UPI0025471097|nr:uncharacterized protein N7520_004849 [Penicillium odoratum]KAJ5765290.1 hypothetical protein N7520_004849 [Penicillium odoratum]